MTKLGIYLRPRSQIYFCRVTSPYSKQSTCLVGTVWAARDSSHYGLLHNVQQVMAMYQVSFSAKRIRKPLVFFSIFIFIRYLILTGLQGGSQFTSPVGWPPIELQTPTEGLTANKYKQTCVSVGAQQGHGMWHNRVDLDAYQLSEPPHRSTACLCWNSHHPAFNAAAIHRNYINCPTYFTYDIISLVSIKRHPKVRIK